MLFKSLVLIYWYI